MKQVESRPDKTWALYKPSQGKTEQILDDHKCEECYAIWADSFGWVNWIELVDKYHSDDKLVVKGVDQARELLRARSILAQKPFQEQEMQGSRSVGVRVYRPYIALNDLELKKELNIPNKLPKTVTSKLPSVQLPSDHGGSEKVYLFLDPSNIHRRVEVTCMDEVRLSTLRMPARNHLWEEQGERHFEAEVSGCKWSVAPHLTLEDWKSSQQSNQSQDGRDMKEADGSGAEDEDEELQALTGIAAAAMRAASAAEKASQKKSTSKQANVRRSSSGTALGDDAASDVASMVGKFFKTPSMKSSKTLPVARGSPQGSLPMDVLSNYPES
eukprot:5518161-Amphidinium_carterae.1